MLWMTWVLSESHSSMLTLSQTLLQDLLPKHGCSPFFWDNQFHSPLLSTGTLCSYSKERGQTDKVWFDLCSYISFCHPVFWSSKILSVLTMDSFTVKFKGVFYFFSLLWFLWRRDFCTVSKITDKWIYKIMERPDKELLINLQSLYFKLTFMKRQNGEVLEFWRKLFPVVSAQNLGLNESSGNAVCIFFRALYRSLDWINVNCNNWHRLY